MIVNNANCHQCDDKINTTDSELRKDPDVPKTIVLLPSHGSNENVESFENLHKRNKGWQLCMTCLRPYFLLKIFLIVLILSACITYIRKYYATVEINQTIAFNNNLDYLSSNIDTLDQLRDEYHEQIKALLQEENNKVIYTRRTIFFKPTKCSVVPEILRFDCYPEDGASQLSCENRGCCWNPIIPNKILDSKQVLLNIPYCYYPDNWNIYKYADFTKVRDNFSGLLQLTKHSSYKDDVTIAKVEAIGLDSSTLRVKIYDPSHQRYEPPWPIRPPRPPFFGDVHVPKYKFYIDGVQPGFRVQRSSDNTTIFDSIGVGGFIFADQFLQISSLLPTHNIYGIGEHQTSFKLNTNWQSFTLFNKDQAPIENANLYGSHPFYFVIEETGNCYGVLFLNSNAMDVILQPTPAITFRTIGGIFDIYFFLGPSPADVLRQYSEIVGKPFFPPYWSLGFHLCRYGYGSLNKTREVWNRTRAAGIPFDTQWNDLDYMDKNNDFTYNKEKFKYLPQFIDEIHAVGMHYIPLIDAGISASEVNGSYLPYDEGVQKRIFVKNMYDKPFVGKVWNLVSTVWPDFTNPKTQDYYFKMMQNMHTNFAYDGAWIDMNEPSNFYDGEKNGCTHNKLDYPEYVPNVVGRLLSTKTLCMNAKHYLGSHYDLHNTYGTSQAITTNYALRNIRQKRPFIISRSTWVGHGYYAGHWTGDVFSTWHDIKMSIPAILSLGLFQIPMVGADICGFNDNTTVPLCNRWMQLGAFYPFSRNHNSDSTIEQDPVAMGDLVVESSKKALKIRYSLLPYLYTLLFRAHKFGESVVRPLFFEFINDSATYDIDTQFLWGSSLMINPVLEENATEVAAYIPRGVWYDIYTKQAFFSIGKIVVLNAPLDTIPLLIRGGSVLPIQKPDVTTTKSRENNFKLLVVLDQFETARGELYWDDGDSLDSIEKKQYMWLSFTVQNATLSSKYVRKGFYAGRMVLEKIQIIGVMRKVSRVFLDMNEIGFTYNKTAQRFDVKNLAVDMKKKFVLRWEYVSIS